jgi:hypothetical protein
MQFAPDRRVLDQGAHAFNVLIASRRHCDTGLLAGVLQLTFEATAFKPKVTFQASQCRHPFLYGIRSVHPSGKRQGCGTDRFRDLFKRLSATGDGQAQLFVEHRNARHGCQLGLAVKGVDSLLDCPEHAELVGSRLAVAAGNQLSELLHALEEVGGEFAADALIQVLAAEHQVGLQGGGVVAQYLFRKGFSILGQAVLVVFEELRVCDVHFVFG